MAVAAPLWRLVVAAAGVGVAAAGTAAMVAGMAAAGSAEA
jgi:hypothetical protein